MPYYKRSIDGAKNRWKHNLGAAMKRHAHSNPLPAMRTQERPPAYTPR